MVRSKHVVAKQSTNKFQSVVVKGRYDSVVNQKCFIPDKGFRPACLDAKHGNSTLSRSVTALQWEKFCEPQEMPDSDVVREFYVNMRDNQSATVPVHGKVVPFSARAINDIFSLPNFANDGYSSMLFEVIEATFTQVLSTVPTYGAISICS